jgi:hypothetical protein
MKGLSLKHLMVLATALVLMLAVAGCGGGQAVVPAATTVPPEPTAAPPPMADKLILYGDLTKFGEKGAPDTCTLKNRFTRGEGVGFRMTAIDPLTGKYVETAELVVHVTYAGKTVDVPMRYRGTGDKPRPGFWTGKWVVPDDAPTGIVQYTVTGKDDQGRTGDFKPFQIEPSELTIVD